MRGLATGPPLELVEQVFQNGITRSMMRPPEEYVGWAAAKLGEHPYLSSNFESMAKRWARQDPEASVDWLGQQAGSAILSPASLGRSSMTRRSRPQRGDG